MNEMKYKYLSKLKECRVFTDLDDDNDDDDGAKQNYQDNSTNSPMFDNSQIENNNFKMPLIDI